MDVVAPRAAPARRGARALLLLVPALAFIALLALGVARRGAVAEVGEPAPDFRAPLLEGGGSLRLSALEGRPVVLNFWASWCVPCEQEAPLLRRAARAYAGRVTFVGVDIKDARSDALAFAARHDLDYPLVRDRGEIAPRYGLTGQPETFFIDSSGTVVSHVAGPLLQRDLYALLDILVARDA